MGPSWRPALREIWDGRRLPVVGPPPGLAARSGCPGRAAGSGCRRPSAPAVACGISPRQIDRRAAAGKRTLKTRRYGRTKPGHPAQAPHSAQDGSLGRPPSLAITETGPRGPRRRSRSDGEFAHSLNVTDIHTTWNETRAVLGRGEHAVQAALERDPAGDCPSGSAASTPTTAREFINDHLYRYCQALEIQFTRGRPYKKDDNAHVEQKNWTHVRKLVGYHRYDSAAAVAALNDLYRHELRLFQNLFLPSVKLLRKERVGSRVRRRYDAPRTPLDRLRACPEADPGRGSPPRRPARPARSVRARHHDRSQARAARGSGDPGPRSRPSRVSFAVRPSRRHTHPPRPTHLRDFTFGNRLRRPRRPRRLR